MNNQQVSEEVFLNNLSRKMNLDIELEFLGSKDSVFNKIEKLITKIEYVETLIYELNGHNERFTYSSYMFNSIKMKNYLKVLSEIEQELDKADYLTGKDQLKQLRNVYLRLCNLEKDVVDYSGFLQ